MNDTEKMPGHWLLAKMGKRVLRPGGLELSHKMLASLDIRPGDEVVEFAPGLGVTARATLARKPASYTAIERDAEAAAMVRRYLTEPRQHCQVGTATETGLSDETASVVYGEAMLTMQGAEQKRQIISEAFRLLKPGGRYGIHELGFTPDDLPEQVKDEVSHEMSRNIHVGARPLTGAEWRRMLEDAGFDIVFHATAPMHLLEPLRLVRDEGLGRALRFISNVLRSSAARKRVLSMRRMFRKNSHFMQAVAFVAVKPLVPAG